MPAQKLQLRRQLPAPFLDSAARNTHPPVTTRYLPSPLRPRPGLGSIPSRRPRGAQVSSGVGLGAGAPPPPRSAGGGGGGGEERGVGAPPPSRRAAVVLLHFAKLSSRAGVAHRPPRPRGPRRGLRSVHRAAFASPPAGGFAWAAGGVPLGAEVANRCSRAHVTGEGPRRGSRGWGRGAGFLRVPRRARRRVHPARGGLGRARGWLCRAPVPSRPAREEEEQEGEGGMRKWVRNVTGRCAPPRRTPPPPLPAEAASASLGKRVFCCCGSPALSVDGYQGIPRDVFPCDPLGRKT